ncbi:MAG: aminotransferase class V-fold PLP-dependent enzyme [Solirubrobacterales bacterium]
MPPSTVTPAGSGAAYDVAGVRDQFPVLRPDGNGHAVAYLDNGATAQKPEAVIDAVSRFYRTDNANVHRGVYALSERATDAYEGARAAVAAHIGGQPREVVFTGNATESVNLVAHAWGRTHIGAGDRILVTDLEHHANLVPWQVLAAERGAELDWAPITDEGRLDLDAFDELLARGPKLVAISHISNVLGTVLPVADLCARAKAAGATVLVDGAQAAPKIALDVEALGADFYVFTGHKLYGPTGIGVLWGRGELLGGMPPFMTGGSMIRTVEKAGPTWADVPARFEAGTPPIAQAVGLHAAIDWVNAIGLDAVGAHEAQLASELVQGLATVPGCRVFGPPPGADRVGIASFVLDGVHPHDISEILNRHDVCVRAGHHCAQPLMARLGVPATSRASLGVYNDSSDVQRLVDGLHDVRRVFKLDD